MDAENIDQTVASPKALTGNNLVDRIEALRLKRVTRAKRTHLELREDLVEAFEHATELSHHPAAQDVLKAVLNKKGLKFSTLDLCIKHVIDREFGETERQRTFAYRRALQVAAAKGVESNNLAEWLEKNGGVDKIAAANPVRPRNPAAKPAEQTSDAFAQKKDFLFEVDLPPDAALRDGRHVAVVMVYDGKIRFTFTSTDYKMWAGVSKRAQILRDEARQRQTSSAGTPPSVSEVAQPTLLTRRAANG